MKTTRIETGFIAAGLMNLGGVLLFSRGLSNEVLMQVDPVVMGRFGLIMIMVWGLAYIAVARRYAVVPWLVGVFCLEKIAYTAIWALWMAAHALALPDIFARDALAGTFYAIYGINDLIFAVFFGWVFLVVRPTAVKQSASV